MIGVPLSVFLPDPRWVITLMGPTWPCSLYEHTKRDGTLVSGVLCIVLDNGILSLQVRPPDLRVVQARGEWLQLRADMMGGAWRKPMQQALALAGACRNGNKVTIGYCKKPGDEAVPRRLARLAPGSNGLTIVAHDLDKDAPRSFRLDRIVYVRVQP